MSILKNISWQIILLIFLAIFFLRNLLMPFLFDDYAYSFIWDGEGAGNLMDNINPDRLQRVQSFSDILYSQYQHYLTWGGRTIAHIFVQFFVWQGKIFFDMANVLVMAALIFLLFKVATGLKLREMNKIYLLWILTGIYFCTPADYATTLWLTGSCNYLWMCTLEILFLLPFALRYWRKDFWAESSTGKIILMAFLGLMAGWSNEPGAFSTIFAAFLFCLYFYREKNLQTWMKAGFLFLMIGFALLIFAPGNSVRTELCYGAQDSFFWLKDFWTLKRFYWHLRYSLTLILGCEIILFVPIIFYFAKFKTSEKNSKFIAGFLAASIFSLLVMMFSPEFPDRSGLPSTIFLLIASTAALKEILPRLKQIYNRYDKKINIAGNIFISVWIINFIGCLYVENSLSNQLAERVKIVEAHRAEDLIIIPPLEIPKYGYIFFLKPLNSTERGWWAGDLIYDSNIKHNITFAKYYGVKEVATAKLEK